MKNPFNISASILLLAAACAGQEAPVPPLAPAAAPVKPSQPMARQQKEIEQILKRVAEDTYKAKVDLMTVEPFGDQEDPNRTLILARDPEESKNQSDTEEDLNVMAHILEKASASLDERNARSIGITFRSPFGNSHALRNLYLEGYGAIFFLDVNYSLTPVPAKTDDDETKPEATNEWEEARRELSHPRGGNPGASPGSERAASAFRFATAPKYSADRVESLKKDLTQALKNAVNIRKLKSDESVTIVVTGRNPASGRKGSESKGRYRSESNPPAPNEKLIVRARKSDIEAFQSGTLSFEDFRKKVTFSFI